jgi:thiamine biosynthesis lipoprotein
VTTVQRVRRTEPVMGTLATVEICDPLDGDPHRLADEVFGWLREVDERFSTYRDDSEVCRLNRGELRPPQCSADMRHVLAACADLWRETDGFFDAYATGTLDPSGYVKGWSVQVASEFLTSRGAPHHLVDAGGDIQTRGRPAPGELWQVGVRHPWDPAAVCWILTGTDLAVATSGTYERGPHVIDPRTGRPAVVLRSVTVVGRDLALADGYATAAVAMGTAGLDWLARLPGHESAVVAEDGSSYRSAGLDAYLVDQRDRDRLA